MTPWDQVLDPETQQAIQRLGTRRYRIYKEVLPYELVPRTRRVLRGRSRLESKNGKATYAPVRIQLDLCCGHRIEYLTSRDRHRSQVSGLFWYHHQCWQCPPRLYLSVIQDEPDWVITSKDAEPDDPGSVFPWVIMGPRSSESRRRDGFLR